MYIYENLFPKLSINLIILFSSIIALFTRRKLDVTSCSLALMAIYHISICYCVIRMSPIVLCFAMNASHFLKNVICRGDAADINMKQ